MSKPDFPIAAQPRREIFDAWNSSSTGHQRAENRLSGSTSWRDSRTAKLAAQFAGSDERVADTVGAGSEGFVKGERTANGGWKRGVIPLKERGGGQRGLMGYYGKALEGKSLEGSGEGEVVGEEQKEIQHEDEDGQSAQLDTQLQEEEEAAAASQPAERTKQIFAHLTFHINGSTYPHISDHKLKHLVVAHGARISLTPARRSVTHVILGRDGGGLAAGKIQKEIKRTRSSGGNQIHFVDVEWVLESVKVGKRVDERRFEVVVGRPTGVKGFEGFVKKK
ncbi:hypothetical protein ANO11243_000004 [Dothideomycetidae sp. 11243]|nr:hypothetical protein ANO11243_000004 [fungal sp. No.11243]